MKEHDMIERVARAIWAARYDGPYEEMPWVVAAARAAIEAMREPTIDMVVAGTEQWLCEAAMEDRSEANWRAMIDEALRETV
jgi:hypothetical protein